MESFVLATSKLSIQPQEQYEIIVSVIILKTSSYFICFRFLAIKFAGHLLLNTLTVL